MKKISILLLLVFSAAAVFSQSLDEINEMLGKKEYKNAKTGIDKYLSDPKNSAKAEGWYYKGRIYNVFSKEPATAENDAYELKNTAYEAFKKYQQLDDKDLHMKLEAYGSYLDLYFGLYDLGATQFNNKNFTGAYASFKKALEVEDYILAKNYTYTQVTLSKIDTSLILNTAKSAIQAKNDDLAVPYYKKIVDANITGEANLEAYEFLVEYYNKKEDAGPLAEVLAKGKKYYPSDNYWDQIELNNIAKKGDQAALYAKYDEILATNPKNFVVAYNYAVDLYKKINSGSAKDVTEATKDKLTSVLKIAIASDDGIDATVLMANHMYNTASDYLTAISLIKGTKPEDVKKKNDLKIQKDKALDDCIMYSDLVVKYYEPKTDLKASQNANFKIVLGYLSEIYNLKGNKAKADEYDKKRAAVK